MSKELEALEGMFDLIKSQDSFEKAQKYYDILEEALHRLEAIDNANPSKALECLEKLKGMEISSMPFSDEYGTQEVDLNDIRKVGSQLNTDFREYTTTIKQALLKAQEPKKYLKWEDLEFTNEVKEMKVKLGDNTYEIEYYICNALGLHQPVVILKTSDFIAITIEQFFNDLRLERVEE